MSVTIRPVVTSDVRGLAELIEGIERFYGTTDADIQPFDEREAQVEGALFGSTSSREGSCTGWKWTDGVRD